MEFCAMPDHVTLMTEVVALCVDAGNHEAALALLSEHFDWLDAYEQTLLAHAAALSVGAPLGSYRRAGSRSGPWARAGGSSRGGRPRPIRVPSVKPRTSPDKEKADMQEKEALMHCNPTRRTFLKGTAATAALAAVGTCSVAAWRAEQAEAAATGAVKIQGASLCNGCSSKCGLIATALDGGCGPSRA